MIEIVGVVGLRPYNCVYDDCEWRLMRGMFEATSMYLRIFENLGKAYGQRKLYQNDLHVDIHV